MSAEWMKTAVDQCSGGLQCLVLSRGPQHVWFSSDGVVVRLGGGNEETDGLRSRAAKRIKDLRLSAPELLV
jgi:hypothetical protein